MSNFREDFYVFKSKDYSSLVSRVTALEQRMGVVMKTVEGIKMPEHVPNSGSNVDDSVINMINTRLGNVEVHINELRDLTRLFKHMQDQINTKADKCDLEELEKLMMNRLNDIITALTKQFADKVETKKALKLLERQLKNLYDLFMSKGGQNANEDEAMFSKKPLGGFSCASCEKDLTNLYGKKVEFMPWSKLPFRDPAERIARVGQGFSKMLSMINVDQLSRYEQNSKF